MKMKVWLLRNLVLLLVAIITLLVLAGSMMNENNHKFSRSRNTPCTHGILVLNEADSHTCCASPHHANSWVCIASFDYLNSIISSRLAFVIPILPLFANVVFAGDWRSKGWLKRLFAYLALFILRTVGLYLIPYYIQEWAQRSTSQSIEDCWCRAFVSETKCKMHFDFSDHIVLNVVQYMLPCVLELHYSLSRVLNLDSNGTNNGSSGGSASFSSGTNSKAHSIVEGRFGTVLLSALRTPHYAHISMAVSCALLCVSARSLLLTGMFFHTYAENAVGYAIAVVVAALPLYSNYVTGLWVNGFLG